MNKYTLLLLLLHFAVINACGQNPDKRYHNAKEYFDSGEYEKAAKEYEAWEKLSNKKNTSELAKTRKCITLKSEANAYYAKHDLGNACKKYTELSKLNPKDGLAKQRIKECCPTLEPSKSEPITPQLPTPTLDPEPSKPTPLPVATTPLPETTLSVSNDNITFDAYGGEVSILLSTNAATWSVSKDISWCKITKKSDTSLTLTCEPNTDSRQLNGSFYIQASNKSIKINVLQEMAKDPLAMGDTLFKEKKYDKALTFYTLCAERGDAFAQARLGRMYAEGLGVLTNNIKAKDLFQKSADNGNAEGENGLGYLYEMQGSYKEAVKWYRRSAERGFAPAQYNLGLMYEYGLGVGKNIEEAGKWYQESAKQGCLEAHEIMITTSKQPLLYGTGSEAKYPRSH